MSLLFAVIIFIVAIVSATIRVVPQSYTYVIERLGKYQDTWHSGLHFLIPVLDRVVVKASLKEQLLDSAPQAVITKDNVSVMIDAVLYFRIFDSKLYAYGIENPLLGLDNMVATTLRNVVGSLELEEVLTSRDLINDQLRKVVDEASDAWGIKVTRVEIKDIEPPKEIREAMEKQLKADREKREQILKAEGIKRSKILVAEGDKESAILLAEAEKEKTLLRAEAEMQALVKTAEGEKQARIMQAEAERQAKLLQAEAEKTYLEQLKSASVDEKVLALKGLQSFEAMSDGKATKLIVPMELQNIVGLSELFAKTENKALNK
ncbi:MAG: SPFH domain-containing protein [Phascolarctobacterium sp.]|nr:SPFH domain-containing protein [Phascolarctobacterium sp.]